LTLVSAALTKAVLLFDIFKNLDGYLKTKYPSSKYLWFRHLAKFIFEPASVLFAKL
jgi:hypothetical protein